MSGAGVGPVLAVADVMVACKGAYECIIEILATNPVSDEKMDVIERRIITKPTYLVEIDADWVMKQSALSCPSELVARRIVLLEPNHVTLDEDDVENQDVYATIFSCGSGDPDSTMEYWTEGMCIFKHHDRWGNVVYTCGY